jgi:hypothetical protein
MVFPPGQGESGEYLMQLWRQYLEQYAENEENLEAQIITGSYHAAEVFGSLSLTLDRDGSDRELIDERRGFFRQGSEQAVEFQDCLVNATFSLYNHLNTLSHQFVRGNAEAENLILEIDKQVQLHTQPAKQIVRAAAALAAAFPLLSIITMVLDQEGAFTPAIRNIEQRFAAGTRRASSEWEGLLNALYRLVEMMQVFAVLTDAELRNQVEQIAGRFKEEDKVDLHHRLRNGFCRLFELGHLVTTHLDGILS